MFPAQAGMNLRTVIPDLLRGFRAERLAVETDLESAGVAANDVGYVLGHDASFRLNGWLDWFDWSAAGWFH